MSKRGYLLAALALAGVLVSVVSVVRGDRQASPEASASVPPPPPFTSFVAGVGRIEASTGDIVVGTPVPGVLTDIYVAVGDTVAKGDPLFKIDDRDLQAQLLTAKAKIDEAQAALEQPTHRLTAAEDLVRLNQAAVSKQTVIDLRDEVAVAKASLELAKAEVAALQIEIERHTVHAPVSGRVLQLHARVGEYAQDGTVGTPPMILGDDSILHVRVDVDENDAWRIRPDAKALAYVRGDPAIRIPLRFEYVEPYMVPKTFLTGLSTERTDVRVLQVVFSAKRGMLPVYVGQRLDVYVQAPAAASGTPKGAH
jgi:HlyD family secretion protein